MKTLTQRNKIVLAIIAVLVITIIAVVAFAQASASSLFGTVTTIAITPSSSTIIVGRSETLSSNASFSNCSWISSNTSVVSITSSSTKSATVLAKGIGTATVTEKCEGSVSGSAAVTVSSGPTSTPRPTNTPMPTPTLTRTPTLTPTPDPWAGALPLFPSTTTPHPGDPIYFTVSSASCNWSVTDARVLGLFSSGSNEWNSAIATFYALTPGSAQVRAECVSNFNGNFYRHATTLTVTP